MSTPCSNFPSAIPSPLSWGHVGDGVAKIILLMQVVQKATSVKAWPHLTFAANISQHIVCLAASWLNAFSRHGLSIYIACLTMLQLKRVVCSHVAATCSTRAQPRSLHKSYRSVHSTVLSQIHFKLHI